MLLWADFGALACSGVDFPMHYLDITSMFFSIVTVNGQPMNLTYCSNTFTRNQAASIDDVDANLGDPFMRNAYVSCVYHHCLS